MITHQHDDKRCFEVRFMVAHSIEPVSEKILNDLKYDATTELYRKVYEFAETYTHEYNVRFTGWTVYEKDVDHINLEPHITYYVRQAILYPLHEHHFRYAVQQRA